ncbi:hypothetical protein HME9304_01498 [Flagellimonas maritima]|uniref:Nuclear transport factor 2 family protein n=1 Tax=Flagellimonas maritima TaxID=1383885 RepID=A0A2Z4LRN0_9FLAO|nr:hypothetical protein [Allomuricauda aurantiaca]AWX44496.1 hypothetical protein HME9304_01498 [Allomuricauda aurantiaca]
MKYILLLFVVLSISGCSKKKDIATDQVRKYYEGFKNSDYDQIRGSISDSLTITEGDYTMPFTPKSFYEQFKWDSVFKPDYHLMELENEGEQIIATVSVKSKKFEFLKNNPLTCRHRFHFKSGKITKIENLECIDADWEIWEKERDSLVKWIEVNHPELNGFVHDLSMRGAKDYLNAIELYKNRAIE